MTSIITLAAAVILTLILGFVACTVLTGLGIAVGGIAVIIAGLVKISQIK